MGRDVARAPVNLADPPTDGEDWRHWPWVGGPAPLGQVHEHGSRVLYGRRLPAAFGSRVSSARAVLPGRVLDEQSLAEPRADATHVRKDEIRDAALLRNSGGRHDSIVCDRSGPRTRHLWRAGPRAGFTRD